MVERLAGMRNLGGSNPGSGHTFCKIIIFIIITFWHLPREPFNDHEHQTQTYNTERKSVTL